MTSISNKCPICLCGEESEPLLTITHLNDSATVTAGKVGHYVHESCLNGFLDTDTRNRWWCSLCRQKIVALGDKPIRSQTPDQLQDEFLFAVETEKLDVIRHLFQKHFPSSIDKSLIRYALSYAAFFNRLKSGKELLQYRDQFTTDDIENAARIAIGNNDLPFFNSLIKVCNLDEQVLLLSKGFSEAHLNGNDPLAKAILDGAREASWMLAVKACDHALQTNPSLGRWLHSYHSCLWDATMAHPFRLVAIENLTNTLQQKFHSTQQPFILAELLIIAVLDSDEQRIKDLCSKIPSFPWKLCIDRLFDIDRLDQIKMLIQNYPQELLPILPLMIEELANREVFQHADLLLQNHPDGPVKVLRNLILDHLTKKQVDVAKNLVRITEEISVLALSDLYLMAAEKDDINLINYLSALDEVASAGGLMFAISKMVKKPDMVKRLLKAPEEIVFIAFESALYNAACIDKDDLLFAALIALDEPFAIKALSEKALLSDSPAVQELLNYLTEKNEVVFLKATALSVFSAAKNNDSKTIQEVLKRALTGREPIYETSVREMILRHISNEIQEECEKAKKEDRIQIAIDLIRKRIEPFKVEGEIYLLGSAVLDDLARLEALKLTRNPLNPV